MLGVKSFILLYLVYMANAQYRRTPLKQVHGKSVPAQSPSYSDVVDLTANTPSLAKLTKIRSIPSGGPELKTVIISKRPTVNENRPPKSYHPNRIRPNRQTPYISTETESIESTESTINLVPELEKIIKPERIEINSDGDSNVSLNIVINEVDSETVLESRSIEIESRIDPESISSESKHKIDLEPKSDPIVELELELESKPDFKLEPTLLPVNTETPDDNTQAPTFRPRSTFSEEEIESEADTKIEPESDNLNLNDLEVLCKKNNTYYAIENSCDTFFECQKFVAKKRVCPDGLLFNPKAKWPRYPCSYPSEVQCGNNTNIDTTIIAPDGECPRRFGTFGSHNNDCEKYIVCEDGRPMLMSCPLGLGFNSKIGGCDWPANIPNCNPKVFKDFICPLPRSGKTDKIYNYRYKNSCKLYVTCINGEPRLLRCDSGLSFDDKSGRCISSVAVANCKTVSEIVDTKLFISRG